MANRFVRRECDKNSPTITKQTLKLSFPEGSKQRTLLDSLSDSEWVIISFDPVSNTCCVKFLNTGVISTMKITRLD